MLKKEAEAMQGGKIQNKFAEKQIKKDQKTNL